MVNHVNPLHVVLERLGCADPAKGAFFPWDEVKNWPAGALDGLVANGLLQPAQPAATIECDGCEENCIMPVTIYPAQDDKPGRAFITCDKRDDIWRVAVDFRRMGQWRCNTHAVCKFIADSLGLRRSDKRTNSPGLFEIGTATGDKRSQMLCLQANGELILVVGHNAVPLAELIEYHDGAYLLDGAMIRQLVDAATTADNRYTPSSAKREARKLDTQAMYGSWQKEYRALKKKRRNMSDVWYAKQIEKMDIANGRNFSTIKKHMTL
ncbi:hypothetical protein GALL_418330 [mine drainage metagenome]|uniref:Uncharacterized protein n=1 Tax=mine drainage metagenome TaxID=410659 RepID=A0A1J5QG45_9ZZZZ